MADRSKIEWTDASYTPIRARHRATGKVGWHCTHATPGCSHCYAEGMNMRLGTGLPFKPGHAAEIELFLDEEMLLAPLRWKKPRMIFVCSMTDLFADFVPDEWIDKIFAVMALAPQHTYQVLTKRSARMKRYFSGIDNGDGTWLDGPEWRDALIEGQAQKLYAEKHPGEDPSLWLAVHLPLSNVWLGVSAEDQRRADERIPDLLASPAAIRFVSNEPALGPVDYTRLQPGYGRWLNALTGDLWVPGHAGENSFTERGPKLDWIIVGGESGQGARPMHPDWARQIRDQCAAAGTAFFFKQWGEWKHGSDFAADAKAVLNDGTVSDPTPEALATLDRIESVPRRRPTMMRRVGKKRAGRLLDGALHDAMPEARR